MCLRVLLLSINQIILELLNNVHICVSDFRIVLLDVGVFVFMLFGQGTNGIILSTFDAFNLLLSNAFLLVTDQKHLVLESSLNFLRNALVFLADVSLLLIVSPNQTV